MLPDYPLSKQTSQSSIKSYMIVNTAAVQTIISISHPIAIPPLQRSLLPTTKHIIIISPPPPTNPGENSPSIALTTAKHTTPTIPANNPILKTASTPKIVLKNPVCEPGSSPSAC